MFNTPQYSPMHLVVSIYPSIGVYGFLKKLVEFSETLISVLINSYSVNFWKILTKFS